MRIHFRTTIYYKHHGTSCVAWRGERESWPLNSSSEIIAKDTKEWTRQTDGHTDRQNEFQINEHINLSSHNKSFQNYTLKTGVLTFLTLKM